MSFSSCVAEERHVNILPVQSELNYWAEGLAEWCGMHLMKYSFFASSVKLRNDDKVSQTSQHPIIEMEFWSNVLFSSILSRKARQQFRNTLSRYIDYIQLRNYTIKLRMQYEHERV